MTKSKKPAGRPERWADACSKARAAHDALLAIISDAQVKWDVEAQKLALHVNGFGSTVIAPKASNCFHIAVLDKSL